MTNKLEDVRDICVFTIQFECMLRISEVVRLKIEDIEMNDQLVKISIRKTKVDRQGYGRVDYIYRNQNSDRDAHR